MLIDYFKIPRSNFNLIAVTQWQRTPELQAHTVHKCSTRTSRIVDPPAANFCANGIRPLQRGMVAAYRTVDQRDRALLIAPNCDWTGRHKLMPDFIGLVVGNEPKI